MEGRKERSPDFIWHASPNIPHPICVRACGSNLKQNAEMDMSFWLWHSTSDLFSMYSYFPSRCMFFEYNMSLQRDALEFVFEKASPS